MSIVAEIVEAGAGTLTYRRSRKERDGERVNGVEGLGGPPQKEEAEGR